MKLFQIESPLFKIDYKRLVLLLLPTFLRQPRIFAFLMALTSAVAALYDAFKDKRTANLIRIRRNGQTCYLQKLLNDEMDAHSGRRIVISDGTMAGDWLLARDEKEAYQLFISEEVYLPGTPVPVSRIDNLVYSEALIISNTAFFYVSVPWKNTDEDLDNKLRSYLNEFKLISKKYKINYL